MEQETILESIFLDREQSVLCEVTEEERKVIAKINNFENEEKLRELIKKINDRRLKEKIEKLLEDSFDDILEKYSVSLEKYYKQGFKDGVNLVIECVS